jgi:hypothetical protein
LGKHQDDWFLKQLELRRQILNWFALQSGHSRVLSEARCELNQFRSRELDGARFVSLAFSHAPSHFTRSF